MAVSAKELIGILEGFDSTEKAVVCKNIDIVFNTYYGFKYRKGSKRSKIIGGITRSSENTVMAWGNSSRPIKIPFIKLLQIADALEIPYEYLLREDSTWLNDDLEEHLKGKIAELESIYGD